MTKTIKISAVVAAVLLVAGMYFKNMHWPGANALLTTGTAGGTLLFILLIAGVAYKLPGRTEKYSIIVASLTLILGLVAFLFRVLHLPGSAILIWIADIGIFITAVLFIIDVLIEKEPIKLSLKIIVAFFILFLVMIILLLR
ncbi:MAG TPA: hypothetical protein VK994_00645 [Bacteroidales bacterium]|nr:hypothetical protein [Bacteroidales bacterium]